LLCSSAASEEALSIQNVLYHALWECRDLIDVSELNVQKSDAARLLREVLHDSPELFHVNTKFSYSYNSSGRILSITPSYRATGKELAEQREFYYATVSELLAAYPRPSCDAEAVLYIHDTLASNYDYDTEYKSYDAYSLFKNGRGVCQAYSLAFVALCREWSIEAHVTVSDAMDHAWNTVRVDGAYYHVDVTRDDPITDCTPSKNVLHSAFLRSDAGIESLGYREYDAGTPCDSQIFERDGVGILGDVSVAAAFLKNGIFVFNGNDVFKVSFNSTPSLSPLPTGDSNGDGCVDACDILCARAGESLPFCVYDEEKIRGIILDGISNKYLYDSNLD
jgi:hypothetical protein